LLKTSQSNPFALSLASAMKEADHQALQGQSMQEFDAAGMVPPRADTATRWSGFLTGQIALDSAPQGGYPTQHFTTGSVMAGLDYRLTKHLLVGGLFNYAYTGGTLDNLGSRETANSYAPGLFAGYKIGGLQIDGLTQYSFNAYKVNRNIVLPGYAGTATGEPDSNQYDASLMADYYFHPASGLDIGPSGGLAYTHMNVGGFTETGSPYALRVSKESVDSFRTLLGFQGHWHLNKKLMPLPLVVSFNAFWQHEYIGRSGSLVASFSQIGSGSFLYNQPSPSRNSAILGLGIGGYLTKHTSLFVNYQTQIGDHRQFAQTVMAGVSIGF
jgi:outer membrane autotransporter protein